MMTKNDMDNKEGLRYVGFQGRVFATFIDLFLGVILLLPFANTQYPQEIVNIYRDLGEKIITEEEANKLLIDYVFYGQGRTDILTNTGIEMLVGGIIVILFWLYKSGTPGKLLLRMSIVDATTLEKPSVKQWIIRYFGYLFSVFPLFLGFFWIAKDKRRQGWHDKLANTIVIYTTDDIAKHYAIATTAIIILTLLMTRI